jgi:hypothetical protein
MIAVVKIYCEHGALTNQLKKLGRSGCVELVNFPYDSGPGADIRKFADLGTPSEAKCRDLNLPIKDLPGIVADYSGSVRFDEILSIVGRSNRRDALHVDSAFKHGCSVFITHDTDILKHKTKLKKLLGIRFFDPDSWSWDCGAGLSRSGISTYQFTRKRRSARGRAQKPRTRRRRNYSLGRVWAGAAPQMVQVNNTPLFMPFCQTNYSQWVIWCREGESNPHRAFTPADFKSAASANFAIPAPRVLIVFSIS